MTTSQYLLQSCPLGMLNYKCEMVPSSLLIQRGERREYLLLYIFRFNCLTLRLHFHLPIVVFMRSTGFSNSSSGRVQEEIRPIQLNKLTDILFTCYGLDLNLRPLEPQSNSLHTKLKRSIFIIFDGQKLIFWR